MTTIEKLDATLKVLYDNKHGRLRTDTFCLKLPAGFTPVDIRGCLNVLIRENYAAEIVDDIKKVTEFKELSQDEVRRATTFYVITIPGIRFFERKGFSGESFRDKRDKFLFISNAVLTLAAVLGTCYLAYCQYRIEQTRDADKTKEIEVLKELNLLKSEVQRLHYMQMKTNPDSLVSASSSPPSAR